MVLEVIAALGAKSGVQKIGLAALSKAGQLGRKVGQASSTARNVSTKAQQLSSSLGVKTPQEVGQFFASPGKGLGIALGARVASKIPVKAALTRAGLTGADGLITKRGIQALTKGATVAEKQALKDAALLTSKGTLTKAGKTAITKAVQQAAKKTGAKAEQNFVRSMQQQFGKTVSRKIEQRIVNQGIQQASRTSSPMIKGLLGGLAGAAAIAVPAGAYIAGKQSGAKEYEEQLLNESDIYEQAVEDTLEQIPAEADPYVQLPTEEPIYDDGTYPYIDPAMQPDIGYYTPYEEALGTGLMDGGSVPQPVADYSEDPDMAEDVDYTEYRQLDGSIQEDELPEDLSADELIISEDPTDELLTDETDIIETEVL